jgi:hypothetical protein
MHDWLFVGIAAVGVWLLSSGVMKRRANLRRPATAADIRPEFAGMGEIVRPLLLFAVAFVALKVTLFYVALGGKRFLTPLDFGAVLFMLGAYAAWLVLATKRPVPRETANAMPDAQPMVAPGE